MNERRALVEWDGREISLTSQARLLGLNRSGLYYQPRPPSLAEVRLKHRIDEIYTATPFYGSRKITAQLQQEGYDICRETVRHAMREMGLQAIYPRPRTSILDTQHRKYPYLLRGLNINRPNQVWSTDITLRQAQDRLYVPMPTGFMYPSASLRTSSGGCHGLVQSVCTRLAAFQLYNYERPHQNLQYRTPAVVHQGGVVM